MGDLMTAPRAAVVGAGAIAPFHIDALRAVGFEVQHLAASRGSQRAQNLADSKGIPQVWYNAEELIVNGDWDCLVLASTTETLFDLLLLASRVGRPCLVEKPVTFRASDLAPLLTRDANIRVAYNRRFYASTSEARRFAQQGICSLRLELPDSVGNASDELLGLRGVRENSVHGLDLLAYVVGRYEVEAVQRIEDGSRRSRQALIRAENGHQGVVMLNWNCPANFSLVLDQSPKRLELRPFEMATTFEGMEILEPTAEIPVRRYVPRKIGEVSAFPQADGLKPGFLGQAQSLWNRVTRGSWDKATATLDDARFALEVVDALIGL